jgi:outer membrane lipopolysaccharide assembly protein LptE/RlpB
MKLVQTVFLALLMFAVSGCAGYHVGADKPHQLANVKKLAIPTFKNDTLEPRIDVLVTNAVIKKMQMDGAFQITSVADADAVLKGSIVAITRRQFRSDVTNNLITTEIQVGFMVKYQIVDKNGIVLLVGQERDASNLSLDPDFQITERQALADAAERLSFSMASDITTGW